MRYIMIMEDGSVFKADKVTDSDKEAVDIGILSIIDTKTMTEYYQNSWSPIPEWTKV